MLKVEEQPLNGLFIVANDSKFRKNRRRTGAFQQIYLKEMFTISKHIQRSEWEKGLGIHRLPPITRKGTDKCHRVHHKCGWERRHISKPQKHFHTQTLVPPPRHVGNHGKPKMLNIFYITRDKYVVGQLRGY